MRTDERRTQRDPDEIAIERYRYLLRTAPPEDIERAHAEAFAQLTPDQRRQVLETLGDEDPSARTAGSDPASLARVATRAELRQPGTMERLFGGGYGRGYGGGLGFGGTFLSTLAGAFVGTAIASALFADYGYPPGDPASGDVSSNADLAGGKGDSTDIDGDGSGGDVEGGDWGGADDGGGFGGDGGDFGGGDFGGGDFGGI